MKTINFQIRQQGTRLIAQFYKFIWDLLRILQIHLGCLVGYKTRAQIMWRTLVNSPSRLTNQNLVIYHNDAKYLGMDQIRK